MGKISALTPKQRIRITLIILLLIPCWVIAWKFEIDFVTLWRTACMTFSHQWDKVYAPLGGRYFYGPFSLILIEPFGSLSFVVGKWVWIGLQTVAYLFFWIYLGRLYPFIRNDKAFWSWVVLWILAINPLHNNFQSNNIQTMLGATLMGCELLTRKRDGRGVSAFLGGFLCSLIAAIKMFPLFIAAYYFLCRPKEVKAGVVAGFLTALVLPFVTFGKSAGLILYTGFWQNLTTYQDDNSLTRVPDILCLPSLVARLSNGSPYTSLYIKISILAVAAAFFYFAWRHSLKKSDDGLHLWALAMALSVFLNPSTRPHYILFYIPAFGSLFLFLREEMPERWLVVASIFISVLLIAFTAEGVVGHNLNDQMELMSLPTYGMIIVCCLLPLEIFLRTRRNRAADSESVL
jgi:hypothetical protein